MIEFYVQKPFQQLITLITFRQDISYLDIYFFKDLYFYKNNKILNTFNIH